MGEGKPKSFKNKTCLSLIVTFIPTYKELKLCMGNRTCTKMLQSSKILCVRWCDYSVFNVCHALHVKPYLQGNMKIKQMFLKIGLLLASQLKGLSL